MLSLFEKIKLTINVNYPIYIHGETGTGKELVAKALHNFSQRKENNFVVVNCATIPKELAESELFGFEKGSFSGASSLTKGKFELSDGGTIFLDEIGELPLNLQSKLLRVIQESDIWRVGGQKPIKLDLRIIVATQRDLEEEVKIGNFREDLYHRLNVVKLEIPPLRERVEDVVTLANYFLQKQSSELGKKGLSFTHKALSILKLQDWKGNVRELENTIAKAIVMKKDDLPLNSKELGFAKNKNSFLDSQDSNRSIFEGRNFTEKINILEQKILVEELERNDWNKSKTANSLDLTRDKLYRLLNKHNLLEKNILP
ncbi:MAG: sigma-54-dependent Fis family transcriptional regulator [Calditrichaeota bacterium]|nr:MAG: sigma-54-dependent Fis family transcriptional regulator [Calditrichota bacterium]